MQAVSLCDCENKYGIEASRRTEPGSTQMSKHHDSPPPVPDPTPSDPSTTEPRSVHSLEPDAESTTTSRAESAQQVATAADDARPEGGVSSIETQDVKRACVIGGGAIGRSVAEILANDGIVVDLIDDAPPTEHSTVVETTAVDSLDPSVLEEPLSEDGVVFLVLHPKDETNLLLAQLARTRFDPDRIIARVSDPTRLVAYDDLDVETLNVPAVVGRHLTSQL